MSDLTPRQIVQALDQYIIGQADAKRAVAVALRNRWRRQQVPEELRDEINPKNIILIGPTGVGKTEIARRLAKLAKAPFVKVEASKFTEVGYDGKDVEGMIRDLTEVGVNLAREEAKLLVAEKARIAAEERLLDLLLPGSNPPPGSGPGFNTPVPPPEEAAGTREKFREMLREGTLDDRQVEIEVADKSGIPMFRMGGPQGFDEVELPDTGPFADMFTRRKSRKVKVSDARAILEQEEANRLIDEDAVRQEGIRRVEQNGIVFLDEIDKVSGRMGRDASGPDVSREGVQRDLLPIVEGSNVTTKYGMVRTDHILFIAAGAFHVAKVADLIPELQGRFPIRVELQSLTENDFVRILKEPTNSLTRQYEELLRTERVELLFEDSGIAEIARIAAVVNASSENIGARRLHTVMERLLEEVSFEADNMAGARVPISAEYVKQKLANVIEDEDLSRYIL